jgi:hypothetical protein
MFDPLPDFKVQGKVLFVQNPPLIRPGHKLTSSTHPGSGKKNLTLFFQKHLRKNVFKNTYA